MAGSRSHLHHHLAGDDGEQGTSRAEGVAAALLDVGVDLPRNQIGVPAGRQRAAPVAYAARQRGAEGVASDGFLEAKLLFGAPPTGGPSTIVLPLERGVDALARIDG